MNFISTPTAPAPGGHYSQAIEAGGFVFVSGMLPGPLKEGETEGFSRQVHAVLAHCRHVLESAGCTLNDVVQCTAYIVGIENWPRFNEIYAATFAEHKPARAVVPVPVLHHDFLVEVQMTACRPQARA